MSDHLMGRTPEGDEAEVGDGFGTPNAAGKTLMDEEFGPSDEANQTLLDDEEGQQAEKPPWIITWPLHLEPAEFDQLVSAVMDELPEEWGLILDKTTIVVDEEPDADEVPEGESEVFGRYRRAFVAAQFLGGGLAGPAMAAPPEIALFQGPLERASSDLDDLRERVHDTLVQQIGHHFGYEDEDEDDVAAEQEGDEVDEYLDGDDTDETDDERTK